VRLGRTRSLTEVRTAGIALERANILLRSAGTVSMGSHCRSSLLPVAGPHVADICTLPDSPSGRKSSLHKHLHTRTSHHRVRGLVENIIGIIAARVLPAYSKLCASASSPAKRQSCPLVIYVAPRSLHFEDVENNLVLCAECATMTKIDQVIACSVVNVGLLHHRPPSP
jgi:hypothetical protein